MLLHFAAAHKADFECKELRTFNMRALDLFLSKLEECCFIVIRVKCVFYYVFYTHCSIFRRRVKCIYNALWGL